MTGPRHCAKLCSIEFGEVAIGNWLDHHFQLALTVIIFLTVCTYGLVFFAL